jgi:hypothetical protein
VSFAAITLCVAQDLTPIVDIVCSFNGRRTKITQSCFLTAAIPVSLTGVIKVVMLVLCLTTEYGTLCNAKGQDEALARQIVGPNSAL